ncbi:GNAT family N-acetyltransferase [Feifania hominis]|uniref:GNAT family N-acetyltransferase n=1 Tax=Feifania hominis TaxID=2763660 RepID=A0A926HUL7_9FIRM|nr:GNAT family N-acetyltransferase [Feifania hominis]MBC8537049.1 GNAT family N-acetyltransferase [Feifania hominis]
MFTLRAFEDGDLPLLRRWLYEPHVARWFPRPQGWLDEARRRRDTFSFIRHFIAQWEDGPVGFCQYYEYARSGESWQGDIPLAGTYSIDYLIGERQALGRGLGRRMVSALLERVRRETNARRVIVQPERDNAASCRTLVSCGFHYDEKNRIYRLEFAKRHA